MISDIEIRSATLFDLDGILKVSEIYIKETASFTNNIADVTRYLRDYYSYSKLESELVRENTYFYIALKNNSIVAYMTLNEYESRTIFLNNLDNYFQIQRLFSISEFRNESLYDEFLNIAITKARDFKYKDIIIDLYENNKLDIDYFTKHGFDNFFEFDHKIGAMTRHNIVLKKNLLNLSVK